jgi:hypothetical protein
MNWPALKSCALKRCVSLSRQAAISSLWKTTEALSGWSASSPRCDSHEQHSVAMTGCVGTCRWNCAMLSALECEKPMTSSSADMGVGLTSTQPIMLPVTGREPSSAYAAARKAAAGCSLPSPQPISLQKE